jgi:hypothetical protein
MQTQHIDKHSGKHELTNDLCLCLCELCYGGLEQGCICAACGCQSEN